MAQAQPSPNPAPEPVQPQAPAQEPDTKQAEQQPATQTNVEQAPAPSVTLTDDQKNYLKGQGLTDEDLSSPEALVKIINHAQTSQKTLSETKSKLDAITQTVNPAPAEPTNPLLEPVSQPQNGQPQSEGLDPITAFTLTSNLANSFPSVKEELTSGKLYQDMQALGVPIKTEGGQVNLNGILKYAELRSKELDLEKKLEEINKPGEGTIPDANPSAPPQPAEDAPMTKQMALAIAQFTLSGNTHPRAEEAKQFLQKSV